MRRTDESFTIVLTKDPLGGQTWSGKREPFSENDEIWKGLRLPALRKIPKGVHPNLRRGGAVVERAKLVEALRKRSVSAAELFEKRGGAAVKIAIPRECYECEGRGR